MIFIGYDNTSERYVVHWLDNFGGRFSETLGYGLRSGNSIKFVSSTPTVPSTTHLHGMKRQEGGTFWGKVKIKRASGLSSLKTLSDVLKRKERRACICKFGLVLDFFNLRFTSFAKQLVSLREEIRLHHYRYSFASDPLLSNCGKRRFDLKRL